MIEDHTRIEIAPGADLTADRATWPWVDITGLWRKREPIAITGGRRDEGGTASPSRCTVKFDGRGGELWSRNPLSPWFGTLGVNTPLRVRWTDAPEPVDRFDGLISELPPRRDQSGNDSTVTVRADAATRSRQQGKQALNSPLRRSLAGHPNIVAYWPMEDDSDAGAFASPIPGVGPIAFSGNVDLAEDDTPNGSLEQLPTFRPGSVFSGGIPTVQNASSLWQVSWLFRMDEPSSEDRTALRVGVSSGSVFDVRVRVASLGSVAPFVLEVRESDGEGGVIVHDQRLAFDPDFFGRWIWFRLVVIQGSTWSFRVAMFDAETDEKLHELSLLQVSGVGAEGRLTRVRIGRMAADVPGRRLGHISVFNGALGATSRAPFEGGVVSGYDGELAADRFERLCDEEGLPSRIIIEPTPPSGGMALVRRNDEDAAVTPDDNSLDVADDPDWRLEFDLPQAANFISGVPSLGLARRYIPTGDQRSWALRVLSDRTLQFRWSTDGATDQSPVNSTEPVPEGRIAVRWTLDLDDGGDHTITFYTARRFDAPEHEWQQLGDAITRTGTTSVFDASADVEVGRTIGPLGTGGGIGGVPVGRFFGFQQRNGIGGTPALDVDFTDQATGDTEFTDDAGRPWTLEGEAAIVRPDTSVRMGPQRPETLATLFREIEVADGGIRDGLTYRTRRGLYNQDPPPLKLSIPDGDLPQAPEPTDDDQRLRNEVTVTRVGGSSVTIRKPGARGQSESIQANLFIDELAARLAEHRLTLGTVDEYRFPKINIALHKKRHLIPDWLAVRAGDRLTVEHDTPQMPGVPIDLIIEGWTERIGHTTWDVELNCAPASPYEVAVFGQSRFDTEKATMVDAALFGDVFIVGQHTLMTVATEGAAWITDVSSASPLDIAVDGVVLRAIGIDDPNVNGEQLFSVAFVPVNGVYKTIRPGAKVTLARRTRFGW